jgi:hypothetical protein
VEEGDVISIDTFGIELYFTPYKVENTTYIEIRNSTKPVSKSSIPGNIHLIVQIHRGCRKSFDSTSVAHNWIPFHSHNVHIMYSKDHLLHENKKKTGSPDALHLRQCRNEPSKQKSEKRSDHGLKTICSRQNFKHTVSDSTGPVRIRDARVYTPQVCLMECALMELLN